MNNPSWQQAVFLSTLLYQRMCLFDRLFCQTVLSGRKASSYHASSLLQALPSVQVKRHLKPTTLLLSSLHLCDVFVFLSPLLMDIWWHRRTSKVDLTWLEEERGNIRCYDRGETWVWRRWHGRQMRGWKVDVIKFQLIVMSKSRSQKKKTLQKCLCLVNHFNFFSFIILQFDVFYYEVFVIEQIIGKIVKTFYFQAVWKMYLKTKASGWLLVWQLISLM